MERLTDFDIHVLRAADKGVNGGAGSWDIAARWRRGGKIVWNNPAARGVLVAHVSRAGYKLEVLGLANRLPPTDRWGQAKIFVTAKGREYLKGIRV